MTDVIVIPEGEHSPWGPSSAERWMACPDSIGQGQTEYAAEGTAAHSLSEWVRQGKPLADFRGRILQVGDYQFKVGKALMDGVQTFVDDVSKIPGAAVVEGRVSYEELVAGGFGTLDDARMRDGFTAITDFKFGKGVVVEAKENPQLMLYALGLFFKFKWLFEFDEFLLRICQPRVHHFVEWPVKIGHLLQWGYDVVRPAHKRALTSKERKAGPWCKFCGHKNDCPVRAVYKISHETGTFHRDASEELIVTT